MHTVIITYRERVAFDEYEEHKVECHSMSNYTSNLEAAIHVNAVRKSKGITGNLVTVDDIINVQVVLPEEQESKPAPLKEMFILGMCTGFILFGVIATVKGIFYG